MMLRYIFHAKLGTCELFYITIMIAQVKRSTKNFGKRSYLVISVKPHFFHMSDFLCGLSYLIKYFVDIFSTVAFIATLWNFSFFILMTKKNLNRSAVIFFTFLVQMLHTGLVWRVIVTTCLKKFNMLTIL